MFKQATPYVLAATCVPRPAELAEQLAAMPFKPCGPTEPTSWGFVAPSLAANGELVELLGGGRMVLAVRRQVRQVPGDTLRKRVDELAAAIQEQTGRKPGAKRRRELKDEALLELLPQAFTKDSTALVLLDRDHDRMVVDTTSSSMLDGVLTTLCKAIAGFAPHPWVTLDNPASWMAKLLMEDEPSEQLAIGSDLVLENELGRRVSWTNANLGADDVQGNLMAGAAVLRMGLEFSGRTEFTLTDSGQLKGIAFDLAAMAQPDEDAEGWRADAELMTAELGLLLDELEAELGGRFTREEPAAPAKPAHGQAPGDGPDPLYDQAVTLVRDHDRASISLIQRHLAIGYNRAARLLERMEVEGLVSPMRQNGSRELLKAEA